MLQDLITFGAGIVVLISATVSVVLSRSLRQKHRAAEELAEKQLHFANEQAKFQKDRVEALENDHNLYEEFRTAKEESRILTQHTLNNLGESSAIVRFGHIQKLGMEGPRAIAAVDALLDLFESPNTSPGTKWHILTSLGKISRSSLETLIIERALGDVAPPIKAYAAHLTARYNLNKAYPALQAANGSLFELPWVKDYYKRALGKSNMIVSSVETENYPILGYVFLKAPTATQPEIFADLNDLRVKEGLGIIEAGTIQGDSDIILKFIAPNKDTYDAFVMSTLQSLPWVRVTRTFTIINPPQYLHWVRDSDATTLSDTDAKEMTWVVCKIPDAQSGGVVICAQDISNVTEASAVFGDADVIVKIQGTTQSIVAQATSEFRTIPHAADTKSYRLVTGRDQQYIGPPSDFSYPRECVLNRNSSALISF